MTSGVAEFVHAGFVGSAQPFLPANAWATKPSILPPSMSAVALFWPCGPPPFTSEWSTYGLTHALVRGSGTHADAGMPSAPGKVPKYVSKLRFSCWITMMCWILWIPVSFAALGVGVPVPDVHAAASRPPDTVSTSHLLTLMHARVP